MGGCNSKPNSTKETNKPTNKPTNIPGTLITPNVVVPQQSLLKTSSKTPLSEKQIQARIEAPKKCHNLVIDKDNFKVTTRYAYVSQRGYYPDAVDKDNQDSFSGIYLLSI
jgi:hypothetical protein